MDETLSSASYKEHRVTVHCIHEYQGWMVEKVDVIKSGVSLRPSNFNLFLYYSSARAANKAGFAEGRRLIDARLVGHAGNA